MSRGSTLYKLLSQLAAILKQFDEDTYALIAEMHSSRLPSKVVNDHHQHWRAEAERIKQEVTNLWPLIEQNGGERLYCVEGVRKNISAFVLALRERAFLTSQLRGMRKALSPRRITPK